MKFASFSRAATIGVAAFAGSYSSSVAAGWQQTRWGMSPAEVVVATDGTAPLGKAKAGERIEGRTMKVKNVGVFQLGDLTLRSLFYYRDEALQMIQLKVPGKKGCGGLWTTLQSDLGKPDEVKVTPFSRAMIWLDEEADNRVALVDVVGLCAINYHPLTPTSTAGSQ